MSLEPNTNTDYAAVAPQPVQRLVAQVETTPSRWMIAFAGMLKSGKTTLASHLAQAVNARTALNTVVALRMDGFHFTKAALQHFPNPTESFAWRGARWTFDVFCVTAAPPAVAVVGWFCRHSLARF